MRGSFRIQLLGRPRSSVLENGLRLVARARAVFRLKRRIEILPHGSIVHALVRRPRVLDHVSVARTQSAHTTDSTAVAQESTPVAAGVPTNHSDTALTHAAVHRVPLVLEARLLVSLGLLPLLPPLHAHHGDRRHQDEGRHRRRQRRNHDHMLRRQALVRRLGRRHVLRQVARPVARSRRRHRHVNSRRRCRRQNRRPRALLATSLASEALLALANEPIHHVPTRAPILARSALALVDKDTAVLPRESRLATALIVIRPRDAFPSIRARLRLAIVHLVLTQPTNEARNAETAELIDEILAGPAVQTRIALAVVDVDLAALATEARWTGAIETIDKVSAGAAIRTRIGRALVDLLLALVAGEARWTQAGIALEGIVLAGGTVRARRIPT